MTLLYTKKSITSRFFIVGLVSANVITADVIELGDNKANEPKVTNQRAAGEDASEIGFEEKPKLKQVKLSDLNNEELVTQLSNESYTIRETATELVWRRGKPALAALENALLSGNPELVSRSTELLRFIKAGILPDTPPHIAALVEAFDKADNNKKEDIMRELYAERAYTQMLFMLSELDDEVQANNLYKDFNYLAQRAAKDSLANGDVDAAIEQLKMAPKSVETQRSLAYLYSRTGRLENEIARVSKLSDELLDKDWERHLRLEQPSRADIREYARSESLMGVTANLDLLEGDPNMMFNYYSKQASLAAKVGLAVIKAQYEGDGDEFTKKVHAQQELILKTTVDDRPSNEQYQALKTLCLTGAAELALPYLRKKSRYDAHTHAELRELPREALAILGITDENTLKKFIQDNTALAIEELEIDQENRRLFAGADKVPYQDRLLTVAGFYYKRGEVERSKTIMEPLLSELHKQENNEWYKVVESIFNMGMKDLAIEIVTDRGDDDNTYMQMVTYLYDDTVETDFIWNTLLKREGIEPEKSFRDLAVVMGVFQAELEPYLELQDELVKIATRQGVVSLKSMHTALHSVAMFRQDAISAAKYAKLLLEAEDEEDAIPMRRLEYLRSLADGLDWESIVTMLDADRSCIGNSPKWYAIYSIAKRKMGDIEGANELLNYAKLISVGLDNELHEIAVEHYIAEYFDISTEIVERMLIIGSVERGSSLYGFSISYLSAPSNAYVSSKEWGKAAAFFMVNAARDMVERPNSIITSNMGYYIHDFYNSQFTRGMELYLAGEKAKGLRMLSNAHDSIVGDGNLADHFYPAIRTTDLSQQYDLWLEESYQHLNKSLEEFPRSANTLNSLGWILSRAVRRLDEGIQHSEASLKLTPLEASYIDTMGELYHAKGDRINAVKWGEKAVRASKYGRLDIFGSGSSARRRSYSLSNQLERFKAEPHPKADFSNN